MITNKKIIDESDYKYVLTSNSTDENMVNVEIHRFSDKPIVFTIPFDNYNDLDEIVSNRLLMTIRRNKINKIKNG